ncbi:hypothetical protein [Campylobacter iguaniorum]|uniref:hypothetical protein n=1 Tax=Campylobacter iguaniorum TaxID=1244531 RepID=UPI00073A0152|nr:hypothetical protein [Campylobacter iguaniorum]
MSKKISHLSLFKATQKTSYNEAPASALKHFYELIKTEFDKGKNELEILKMVAKNSINIIA